MKQFIAFASIEAILLIALSASAAPAKNASDEVFARLGSLVGEWAGVQDGREVQVTYSLIAKGSTLMEVFRPKGGDEMTTMFSVDGDHLLATHYCSAGNQPQMSTAAIVGNEHWPIHFSLVRVTGLRSPGDFYNTSLELRLDDPDHLTQTWTFDEMGKKGTTIFRFTRNRTHN